MTTALGGGFLSYIKKKVKNSQKYEAKSMLAQ